MPKYFANLGTIAEDEDMLTKEDFFARVDEARKQPGKSFANVDELDQYIRNL